MSEALSALSHASHTPHRTVEAMMEEASSRP